MKNKISVLIFLVSIFSSINVRAQQVKKDTLTFAFWNMENLFDTINDPGKNDVEFTPGGKKKWTKKRLLRKLDNMANVIKMMSKNGGPDLLGICEVEHKSLVDEMLNNYLNNKKYDVAYKESPDKRGIDNGLIYNKEKFSFISVEGIHVELPTHHPTRDILKVILKTRMNDTLFVFVNHWPSRSGGQARSEKNRIQAAFTLKENVDEINSKRQNANILIIGDFNDTPTDKSLTDVLQAKPLKNYLMKIMKGKEHIKNLYNLSYEKAVNGKGTYNYRKVWNMLDQIVVSTSLLNNKGFSYLFGSFRILKPKFIIQKKGKYKGYPFPTYGGKKYLGGYSDHFPVVAEFVITVN